MLPYTPAVYHTPVLWDTKYTLPTTPVRVRALLGRRYKAKPVDNEGGTRLSRSAATRAMVTSVQRSITSSWNLIGSRTESSRSTTLHMYYVCMSFWQNRCSVYSLITMGEPKPCTKPAHTRIVQW